MPDSVEESPVVTEEKKVEEEEEKEVNPKKPQDEQEEEEGSGGDRSLLNTSHDPYYPPIITLPEVVVNSGRYFKIAKKMSRTFLCTFIFSLLCAFPGEEEEDEILKLRAKLFRYDTSDPEEPPVWKERGTGDVKILKHQETSEYY